MSVDSIVPEPGNPQAFNRYSYVLGNPLRYVDPSGHFSVDQIKNFLKEQYGDNWSKYLDAWKSDQLFWNALLLADFGSTIETPTSKLGAGFFGMKEDGNKSTFTFSSASGAKLHSYQGAGPYLLDGRLLGPDNKFYNYTQVYNGIDPNGVVLSFSWSQPEYNYSSGVPVRTGKYRHVQWAPIGYFLYPTADSLGLAGTATGLVSPFLPEAVGAVMGSIGWFATGVSALANSYYSIWALNISYSSQSTTWKPPQPPANCLTSVYCGR